MKAWSQKLLKQIQTFVRWLVHLPVIEPILELLSYQRTLSLLAGLLSFRLAPWLFPNLTPDLQALVAVITTAIFFALFLGLQKEVLVEAKAAVATLPTDDAGYVKELSDIVLKAVLAELTKPRIPNDGDKPVNPLPPEQVAKGAA